MNTQNNTILITGASSGMGFEIAKLFSQKGNKVIITARNQENLNKAASQLDNVTAIACDISNAESVINLVTIIKQDFPNLNMIINNAGKMNKNNLLEGTDNFNAAVEEMQTNYFSAIRLNELLLSVLKAQKEASIINVSSALAFVPMSGVPTYSASKSALHSYTLSLRFMLKDTSIKVFELMPPLVNTNLSAEIGGKKGIEPSQVAEDFFKAFEKNVFEVRVGQTEDLYQALLESPEDAFKMINQH